MKIINRFFSLLLMKSNLLSLAIILLLTGMIGITFAFWDGLNVNEESSIEVGVGVKTIIREVVSVDQNKKLVPRGVLLGNNDIEQIVKEYEIVLSKPQLDPLNFEVMVLDIKVGNVFYEDLINIDIIKNETISEREIVVLVISINNMEFDYSNIYNQEIAYTIEFNVLNNY